MFVEFLKWLCSKVFERAFYIPLIQVLIMTGISIRELFGWLPNETLVLIGYHFGNSTITLLFYGLVFFNPFFKSNLLVKWSVAGLILNHILYKVGEYLSSELYQQWYTLTAFMLVYGGLIIYVYQKELKRWI